MLYFENLGGPVIKDTPYPDCDNVLKCVCVAFPYQPILRLLTGQTLPPQAEEFLKTRGQGGLSDHFSR